MPTPDNKSVIRRLYEEVWNKRRLEIVPELISPSHGISGAFFTGSSVGPVAYKRTVTQFIGAFPDLKFTVADVMKLSRL